MFFNSLQGKLNLAVVTEPRSRQLSAPTAGLITVFLCTVHAPSVALGANRFGFLVPSAVVLLALLLIRSRRIDPPPAASWLWLVVLGWGSAQVALGLTPDPAEGARVLTRLSIYAVVFLLAADIARSGASGAILLKATATWITAICIFGLITWSIRENPVLRELEAYPTALEATFVNRNAFALYAAFGMFASLAAWRASGGGLVAFVGGGWVWLAAALICGLAVLLTGSRGGVGAAVIGLIVFVISARGGLIAATLGVLLIVGSILGVEFIRDGGVLDDPRFAVHAQLAEAILAKPWIGHGVGGFQDSFRPIVGGDWRWGDWDHAHQQYLETIYELGAPAALASFLAILLAAPRPMSNAPFAPAGHAALVAAAVHALVDFSLAIPSVALTLALLLGLSRDAR